MNTYVKFGILIGAILAGLGSLAVKGVSDTKTYYKTISELNQMGEQSKVKRLRVGGDVAPNSIVRAGRDVHFTIVQDEGANHLQLKVVYNGIDPLPDTFKDGAQALADGKLGDDGVFHATKIQAKCASKYEQKPNYPNARPAAGSGSSI